MHVIINGKPETVDQRVTISELLKRLNVPKAGTAVAVGDTIVSRDEHETRVLNDGDRIEVIRAIGGG